MVGSVLQLLIFLVSELPNHSPNGFRMVKSDALLSLELGSVPL
nr:C388 [uncultured bacterium]